MASATVALIDYGSGNLRSAEKALARAAADAGTAQEIVVTADPTRVAEAERLAATASALLYTLSTSQRKPP